MKNVCFNVCLVLFPQRTFELLKAVLHCCLEVKVASPMLPSWLRPAHGRAIKTVYFFVAEKKKNPTISCFIFKLVALGGAALDIVDFKTFMALFLLLGLCFLYLENEGEAKERCCL